MRRLKAWCLYLAVFLFGSGSFQDAVTARELVVAVNHAPPYRIIEETSTGPVYSGFTLMWCGLPQRGQVWCFTSRWCRSNVHFT